MDAGVSGAAAGVASAVGAGAGSAGAGGGAGAADARASTGAAAGAVCSAAPPHPASTAATPTSNEEPSNGKEAEAGMRAPPYHDRMRLEWGVLSPPAPGDDERLLGEGEPEAFEVVAGVARSPFVLTCDHASRRIPSKLGKLGVPEAELERHIAWDIGAAGLAQKLARKLDAWLVLQNYSRLVIDCNRRLERPDSIAVQSEDTPIPGNEAVTRAGAARRAREIFEPYHARIRRELDERSAAGRSSILLFVHTFTPVFRGVARSWHAGVLYHRDTRLALPLLDALRREPGLEIGDNQPYAATALTDYGLVVHGEERGLPHVELEVRQDLVSDEADQEVWAERLARLIGDATRELGL